MAAPKMSPIPDFSFEVTCVVGTVTLSDTGDQTPVEAAMRLIGQHAAPGVYRFPHEDGGEWIISVEREFPAEVIGHRSDEY